MCLKISVYFALPRLDYTADRVKKNDISWNLCQWYGRSKYEYVIAHILFLITVLWSWMDLMLVTAKAHIVPALIAKCTHFYDSIKENT